MALRAALGLAALLALLLGSAGSLRAQGVGAIAGRLTAGSAGAALPAQLTVHLDGIRQSDRLPTRETAAAADGSFRFEDVAAGSEYAYVVSLTAEGVRYASGVLYVEAGASTDVAIEVYAATERDPGVTYRSLTRLLRRQTADTLSVVEIADVHVPGDRAFIPVQQPGLPPPIRFGVPDGAFGLQPIAGFLTSEVVIGGPGFAVFAGLHPGTSTLVYGYQLALDGGAIAFDWTPSLDAGVVVLLVEEGPLVAEVAGLAAHGPDAFGGTRVQRWQASGVAGGSRVSVKVTDTSLPGALRALRATTADRWALLAAGPAVVLAAAVAVWRRGWRRAPAGAPEARAAQLLAELRAADGGAERASDERRQAARAELLALLEQRPELVGELRRAAGPAAGDGGDGSRDGSQ